MSARVSAWAHALAVMLLLVAIALAFSDVIGPSRGLFFRDHVLHHRHAYFALRESLLEGRLPALTIAGTSGVPFEHLLNGAFTPGTIVLLLGPFDITYDLFVVFHFVLLGLGSYGLATSLGARPADALVGAGIMTLAGPIASLENLVVAAQGLAYAPWALWAFHRMRLAPSPRALGGFALALGFQAQAILPEVLLVDVIGGIFILFAPGPRLTPSLMLRLALGSALGLAIAAIGLMPALESLPSTHRGQGFSYEAASGWCLSPGHLLDFFLPSFFAPPELPFVNIGSVTGNVADPPYLTSLYLGGALALALLGALFEPRARSLAFVALFFLIISMGRHTPVHTVIARLPLLRMSRYAIKYLWPATACIGALAVHGARSLARAPGRVALISLVPFFGLIGLKRALGTPEFTRWLEGEVTGYGNTAPVIGLPPSQLPNLALQAMDARVTFALAAAVAWIFLGLALSRLDREREIIRFTPAILLLLELGSAATFSIRGADVTRQTLAPEARKVLEGDTHRIYIDAPQNKLPEVHHVEGHTIFEDTVASAGQRGRNFHPHVRRYLELDINAHSNPVHVRTFELMLRTTGGPARQIQARAGVRYVSSPSATEPLEEVIRDRVEGEVDQYVYAIPSPRPYVHAYTRWTSVSSTISDLALARKLGEPSEYETAVVYDAPTLPYASDPTCTTREPTPIASAIPEHMEVTVDATCASIVVVLEQVMQGWTVEVDGVPAELLTTELGFIGVMTPPGKHAVRFRYVPRIDRWKWLSVLASALALGLIVAPRRRRPGLSFG